MTVHDFGLAADGCDSGTTSTNGDFWSLSVRKLRCYRPLGPVETQYREYLGSAPPLSLYLVARSFHPALQKIAIWSLFGTKCEGGYSPGWSLSLPKTARRLCLEPQFRMRNDRHVMVRAAQEARLGLVPLAMSRWYHHKNRLWKLASEDSCNPLQRML